ncbi:hypothetical protein ALP39_200485 [Pseudomonas marginalis pv. marginalis]|nr:hypothetical protein ALP39_200485 [Pseudomonas marginalis pv. marginalis]
MELKSRLIFLDTNIYEGKNFQFMSHSLGALKNLIDNGEVRLLITEITKNEVLAHIKKKAASATLELKAIKKNAMILRNIPTIPAHGIFSTISADEISNPIIGDFEKFLTSENVEYVSIDEVKPSYVFERYFSVLPPFAIGDKEKEFADAFVLKALDDLSTARGHAIHLISNDKDMHNFAEHNPRLICSNSIDEFIDAVIKSISIEPSEFAAKALEAVRGQIMNIIHECLVALDTEFKMGTWDSELDNVEIYDTELSKANLISVNSEECIYDIEFTFKADTTEIEKDYDRSPFDHEDGNYPFVLENVFERTFDGYANLQITLSYQDKLIETVDINDYDPPAKLKLSAPYNEKVEYLDVNGE